MEIGIINRLIAGTALGIILNSTSAFAGYGTDYIEFGVLGTAWNPGGDNIRSAGAAAPGAASWSLMAAGIADVSGFDSHSGNSTTAFTDLVGQSTAAAEAYIDSVLNVWAAASDFTNLGQVVDNGVGIGASNAVGDIRVGAIFIDGQIGGNVLAHAYNPCTASQCGAGGSVGGDVHMDDSNTWVDNASAVGDLDLFTVLLHEFGHALGLDHSLVAGSVMEATYAGARRSLTADDIAGIQSIYGAPIAVPLPGALVMFLSGLMALGVFGRKSNPSLSD